MKKIILAAFVGALALSACVSHNFREGERFAYRCAGGEEFSLRRVAGHIEVFAGGQTYTLQPSGEDAYSNGVVTFARVGARTELTGAYGGPYERCRRTGVAAAVF